MKVIAIRWWLNGPTLWQADLIGANMEIYRPGYNVPEQGLISGASTKDEAKRIAQSDIDELAAKYGVTSGEAFFDETITTMLWEVESGED